MNILKDAFPSKYIKSDDLAGQRVPLTVMAVTMEDIGDKEFKPIMRFMGREKGMVINKTNATLMSAIWGEDTDRWTGQKLDLFAMPVNFQGKMVMGLSVAPKLAQAQTAPEPASPIVAAQMEARDQGMDTLEAAVRAAESIPGHAVDVAGDLDDLPF
jgi:hypothetical protein